MSHYKQVQNTLSPYLFFLVMDPTVKRKNLRRRRSGGTCKIRKALRIFNQPVDMDVNRNPIESPMDREKLFNLILEKDNAMEWFVNDERGITEEVWLFGYFLTCRWQGFLFALHRFSCVIISSLQFRYLSSELYRIAPTYFVNKL